MKRIAILLLSMVLALGTFGFNTVAHVSAVDGPCVSPYYNGGQNYQVGNYSPLGLTNTVAGYAYFALSTDHSVGFAPCYTSGGQGASIEWIGMFPTGYPSDPNKIWQVGILRCFNNAAMGICGDNTTPQYFYAAGGCGSDPHPYIIRWATADWNVHDFEVANGSDGLYFFVDGGRTTKIPYTDPRISCWASQTYTRYHIIYDFEAFNFGDSVGDTNQTSTVYGARYKYSNADPWNSPGWNRFVDCAENNTGGSMGCETTGYDSFDVWHP